MQKIEIELNEPWFKDPSVAAIFNGRAIVETVEGASIVISIDDETIASVECTVAALRDDDDWVWDTTEAYGYEPTCEAAKEAAMRQAWHEAMLRLREEVPSEVIAPLRKIAAASAADVRSRAA